MSASERNKPAWPDTIRVAGRTIGHGRVPFVIAELSANHNRDLDLARRLIDAAAESGADAVKLQTYTPDTITLPHSTAAFRINTGLWAGRHLHELYAEAMTPWDWHPELAAHARRCGLVLFSTPFDESAVDFLEDSIDPSLYKVASFELNHLPLLERIGATGKPVILSTGMATPTEIRAALRTLRGAGCPGAVLLKCVSAYPSKAEGFNLRSITSLRRRFRTPVGLSDHTLSDEVAIAATALGACVIEKHLALERAAGGIDSGFSLEPAEFARLTAAVRVTHAALGTDAIGPTAQDRQQRRFRRSIFVASDIRKGETLTTENLRIVRPAAGLEPARWKSVLGSTAKRNLRAGQPLKPGDWQ